MNKGIDKKKYKKALDFAYKLHLKQNGKKYNSIQKNQ